MSATPKKDHRPATNDSARRDNNDIDSSTERWNAWRRQQAKRRGEITAKNQGAK